MPRYGSERITPNQAVDSSKSANIALPVQANLADVHGQGSAMFAVGRALSGMSADMAQQAAQDASRRQATQAAADKKAGAAKAAEHAVTGVAPTEWLDTANKVALASYEETDGINAVDRFKQSLQPELAKLHGSQADIDALIRDRSEAFIADNKMGDTTKAAFMTGLAKTQNGIKEDFLKGSIKESLNREEESSVALLASGIRDKSMLTPEGSKGFRTYLQGKGMDDTEIDGIVVKAATAALASGEGDIPAVQAMLKTASGPDGMPLADGMHKSELDSAAKAGASIQKAQQEKAQFADKANMIQGYDQITDRGIVPGMDRLIADAKKYGMSAEWPTEVRNRAQAAQERFAAEHAKDAEHRAASDLWDSYTPLKAAASDVKTTDLAKIGNERFAAAFKAGDAAAMTKLLVHSADTHAPIGVLKPLMAQLDPSNPDQAAAIYKVYDIQRHISPENAAALLDSKTLGQIKEYEYNVEMHGMTPKEAWGAVKSGTNLDTHVIEANTKEAMKIVAKKGMTDFNDSPWYSFSSNTPIANKSELDTAYRLAVVDAVKKGVLPEIAAQSAMDEVAAKYTRVGNRMVRTYGTGDGKEAQTAAAMTDMGKVLKDQLVSANEVDKDADVFFAPIKGSPNTWRLQEASPGGVPMDATRPVLDANGKPTGEREFIDVIPSNLRAAHSAWQAQETDKKTRNTQAFSQFGISANDLTPEEAKRITAQLDPSKREINLPSYAGPAQRAVLEGQRAFDAANVDALSMPGVGSKMTQEYRAAHAGDAAAKRKAALKYTNDPSNHLETFGAFINRIK